MKLTRRQGLKLMGLGLCAAAWPGLGGGAGNALPTLANGQPLPPVGMGTWITFNVGADPLLRQARTEVVRAFFEQGGGMVDAPPCTVPPPR